MTEAPADPADPQRDLLDEMHYALRLAEERERSAKEETERLQRQFITHYSRLEERVRAAEGDALRAEVHAAGAEDRVNKSLQALRVLRCHLTSAPCTPEAAATARLRR
jgi:hypothetical protein